MGQSEESPETCGSFVQCSPPSLLQSLGCWCAYSLVSLQVQTPGCFLLVNWGWELSPLLMSKSDAQDTYLPEAQSQASVGSYKLLGRNVKPKRHSKPHLPWTKQGATLAEAWPGRCRDTRGYRNSLELS